MKKIYIVFSLALLILFTSFSSCFAYSNNDNVVTLFNACVNYLEQEGKTYYNYVIYQHKETGTINLLFNVNENGRLYAEPAGGGRYNIYANYFYMFSINTEDKAITPSQVQDKSTTLNKINPEYYDLLYSSKNIKTSDTNQVFFQKTPLIVKTWVETTQETILAGVPTMGAKVTETMRIILLCGVGCLALLIGLPLFSKVLRRWVAR